VGLSRWPSAARLAALDPEGSTSALLSTHCSQTTRRSAPLCVALWPYWLRRIDLDEANDGSPPRSQRARAQRAPVRRALRGRSARLLRGGTLARGIARAEESYAVATEIGDKRSQWRAMQFLGEFGVANEQRIGECVTWLERGLELARPKDFRPPRRSGSIRSAWRAGSLGWTSTARKA